VKRAVCAVTAIAAVAPVRFRKRGAELEVAILDAAYDELVACGYSAFSIEGVAARAQTGKASIYRRWPTKQQLVLDAFSAGLPDPDVVCGPQLLTDDMTTRDALVQVYGFMSRAMASGAGQMLCEIVSELNRGTDTQFATAIDEKIIRPRKERMLALLWRGVARGEVRPEAATLLIAEVGPAMILHKRLTEGISMDVDQIASLVDTVVMPMLAPNHGVAHAARTDQVMAG
jgi:AcrR family transcriptional regulator